MNWGKFFFLLPLILVLSAASFGLAYSINDAEITDKDNGMISGWKISNIHYQLGNNVAQLRSVEFDLDKPADLIWVAFTENPTSYFPCVNTMADHWICDVQETKVADMNQLRVVGTGK